MANIFDQFDEQRAKTSTPEEFAQVYGPAAERAAKTLGVDAKTILGQWGLETGWGKSIVPGTNNLGNIKDFAGGGVAATDNMTGSKDKYRAYASPEAFADDFASLIQRKYPGAVGAKDPLAFATALKSGGYAEDPNYVDKVVKTARMAGRHQPGRRGSRQGGERCRSFCAGGTTQRLRSVSIRSYQHSPPLLRIKGAVPLSASIPTHAAKLRTTRQMHPT